MYVCPPSPPPTQGEQQVPGLLAFLFFAIDRPPPRSLGGCVAPFLSVYKGVYVDYIPVPLRCLKQKTRCIHTKTEQNSP